MRNLPVLIAGGILTATIAVWPTASLSGDSFQDGDGVHPAVATNGSHKVVKVNQLNDGVGPLLYDVGNTDVATISTIQWAGSRLYDTGVHPAVASDGDIVIEVHQATDRVGPLWYRLGRMVGSTIQWGNSSQYDTGIHPAVAIQDQIVVAVHQASDGVGPLWYRLGTLNRTTGSTIPPIQWGDSFQYDSGTNPRVAMPLGGLGFPQASQVLEVHQASDGVGPLWSRVGWIGHEQRVGLPPIDKIQWGEGLQYDIGTHPAIAWGAGTGVLEVHQARDGLGPLWYRVGRGGSTATSPMSWGDSLQYDEGMNPVIASHQGSEAVEFHQVVDGLGSMRYRIFIDSHP